MTTTKKKNVLTPEEKASMNAKLNRVAQYYRDHADRNLSPKLVEEDFRDDFLRLQTFVKNAKTDKIVKNIKKLREHLEGMSKILNPYG